MQMVHTFERYAQEHPGMLKASILSAADVLARGKPGFDAATLARPTRVPKIDVNLLDKDGFEDEDGFSCTLDSGFFAFILLRKLMDAVPEAVKTVEQVRAVCVSACGHDRWW